MMLMLMLLSMMMITTAMIVIVIVNFRFLERPQKQSRRHHFHRCLTKTKSIGSGQDPERQADSQTAMVVGGWCLELRQGGRYGDSIMLWLH